MACEEKSNTKAMVGVFVLPRYHKTSSIFDKDEERNDHLQQIVRSGTSIGANTNEANYGQSKADFISKMHIALKETAETEYWLKLLTVSEYITEDKSKSLLNEKRLCKGDSL